MNFLNSDRLLEHTGLRLGKNFTKRGQDADLKFYSYDLCISEYSNEYDCFVVWDFEKRTKTTATHINRLIKCMIASKVLFRVKIIHNT